MQDALGAVDHARQDADVEQDVGIGAREPFVVPASPAFPHVPRRPPVGQEVLGEALVGERHVLGLAHVVGVGLERARMPLEPLAQAAGAARLCERDLVEMPVVERRLRAEVRGIETGAQPPGEVVAVLTSLGVRGQGGTEAVAVDPVVDRVAEVGQAGEHHRRGQRAAHEAVPDRDLPGLRRGRVLPEDRGVEVDRLPAEREQPLEPQRMQRQGGDLGMLVAVELDAERPAGARRVLVERAPVGLPEAADHLRLPGRGGGGQQEQPGGEERLQGELGRHGASRSR